VNKPVAKSFALSACLLGSVSVYAAESINLDKLPLSFLKPFISAQMNLKSSAIIMDEVKEVRRAIDSNKTTHIRMQQYHAGYEVWGADFNVHVPNAPKNFARLNSLSVVPGTSMNGTLYQKLNSDLAGTSQQIFNAAQAEKVKAKALQQTRAQYDISGEVKKQKLMIYVDGQNKAHWAYLVSLYLRGTGKNRAAVRPTYIIDAVTFNVYESWNDVRQSHVSGGGFGGNEKTGKLVYDGAHGNLRALVIDRVGDYF
jgi:pseudolysin